MQHEKSDAEILGMSLEKPDSFSVLIDRYQQAFLRKSMSIVRSKEEAEDIVQETFLKIYKYAGQFKEQEGALFKSWAYQILRNTCYTHYVKEKKYRAQTEFVDFSEYDFEDTNTGVIVSEMTGIEASKKVEYVLSLLPESIAYVVRLYFLEEKSQKEIAKEARISPGAVRARIHRAKKFLKEINLGAI